MIKRSKAQWEELIAEYESSGMSVAEWCRAQGIPPSTFTKYYSVGEEMKSVTHHCVFNI